MMNKYEKKILELAPEQATIHELLRRPKRSALFHFFDLLFDNIFWVADGFKTRGTYFLVTNNEQATLFHISPELDVTSEDITATIQTAAHKKSFIHQEHQYKIYRKIK